VAEGASPRVRGEHATAERAKMVAVPNAPRREGRDTTAESTAAYGAPVTEVVAA
jgi:hypothetical protein